MNKSSVFFMFCITAFFNTLLAANAVGGGFDNTGMGSRGLGMGYALTGIANDASAVYYNPAGLSFIDKDTLYVDLYSYYTKTGFKYSGGSNVYRSDEVFIIPGFFLSKTYDNWALGLGYYTPYAGGGTAYKDFEGVPHDKEFGSGFSAITFALAHKIGSDFSVGAGLSMYVGGMKSKVFDQNISALIKSEYEGIAGYGGFLSILYKMSEAWRIGFSVRSEVPIEMDGKVEFSGYRYDSQVEFTFPYSFELGFGYKPNLNITLGLVVCYRLWDDMDKITFSTEGQQKNELSTGYTNNWLVGLGIEYNVTNDFSIFGGVKYIQSATKDRALDSGSNDVDTLGPSIGVAYDITDFIEINVVGNYVYGLEREYDSKKYDYDHIVFLLGFRFMY